MRIRIPASESLEDITRQLLRVLVNWKHWDELVQTEGGYRNRNNLKVWKENRDILLKKLESFKSDIPNEQIRIVNADKL